MKNKIFLLLFGIILLVVVTIGFNAKKQVDSVQEIVSLETTKDSLKTKVYELKNENDSVVSIMELLDSTLVMRESLINRQWNSINFLKNETTQIKKMGPIVIRDTIYITETKNFWGKKSKSIETITNIDTLELDTIQIELDSVIND